MGYRLVDDYDGTPLDRDHPGLQLIVGGEAWNLHLSEKSKEKLMEALNPFTRDAEELSRPSSPAVVRGSQRASSGGVGKGGAAVDKHGATTEEVRAWAQANKVKNDNGKPVGDRGRISQGVYDKFAEAQKTGQAS